MAKGRYSRVAGKRSATFMLVLGMLFMLSVVLLILFALGILSLPIGSVDNPTANDLSSFAHATVNRTFRDRKNVDRYFTLKCFLAVDLVRLDRISLIRFSLFV